VISPKKIIVVGFAIVGTMILASPGFARPDGSQHDIVAVARVMTPASMDLSFIEPAAGALVAALPVDVEPVRTVAPIAPGKRFGAFDSVAISAGSLPMGRKFEGVTRVDYSALFTDGCDAEGLSGCGTRLVEKLRDARQRAAAGSEAMMVEIVNAVVNRELPYASDRAIWGEGDYWATPSEIALKGAGDCEDFAIAKMWLLRSLGFSPERLQIVVLQNTERQIYHAVLAVHVGGQRLVLDNLSSDVRADTSFRSYMPIVSFVGGKSYIHGFERKRTDMATMPRDLASVMPGEGL
jgi:predicted transglutaminase-like cysteine proteinase